MLKKAHFVKRPSSLGTFSELTGNPKKKPIVNSKMSSLMSTNGDCNLVSPCTPQCALPSHVKKSSVSRIRKVSRGNDAQLRCVRIERDFRKRLVENGHFYNTDFPFAAFHDFPGPSWNFHKGECN